MSCATSIDFASFPVHHKNPATLVANFIEFCFTRMQEDPLSELLTCDPPPEWEDLIDEFYDSEQNRLRCLDEVKRQFCRWVSSAISVRYHQNINHQTQEDEDIASLQIETGEDDITFDLYMWILKSCLEYPPFALKTITSRAVVYDSKYGRSFYESEYTLSDFV